MKNILAAAGLVGALVFAPLASAAPVSQWEYAVTLEWTGATFTPTGNGTTTQNSTLISWGATGGDHTNAGAPAGSARSALEISDTPAVGDITTNGAAAQTNTVTHFNNSISSSFRTLREASLQTTLTLTPVSPVPGPALGPFSTDFTVRFTETPNSTPCGFASVTVCDDIFVITLGTLDFSFQYEGITYDVSIFETTSSLLGLSDAACARAGAAAGCVGFQTSERLFTPATFAFTISAAIPEPGVLALLGLGLLGFGVVRRKSV